jgi:hypothetical protein
MIYATIIGATLGYSKESISISAGVLFGLVLLKTFVEVVRSRNWITNSPSPYVLYIRNLSQKGDLPDRPWIGYLLLSMLQGVLIGAAAYSISFHFF